MEEKWYIDRQSFIFVTACRDVQINYQRKHILMEAGEAYLLYGVNGSITFTNLSSKPTTLKGIVFNTNISMIIDRQILIDQSLPEYHFFVSLFEEGKISASLENELLNLVNIHNEGLSITSIKDSSKHKKIDSRLLRVNRYIRSNYMDNISLQELAEIIEVHPTYLCNSYSRVFKLSPIYYLNQIRMEEAKKLLLMTDLSKKKIASKIGYGSLAQFSALFKRFYEMTPTEYRNTYKNKVSGNNVALNQNQYLTK
jgi:AraC-like DNA-binding protein